MSKKQHDAEASRNARSALRTLAVILARHEIRNLKRLYDEFDHDVMLPLLLGEIALHNVGAFDEDGEAVPDDALTQSGRSGLCPLKPCNAYSIALATGFPRETVRRKIARLVEMGWISRRYNGHLFITSAAVEHFGNLLNSRELPELLETADRIRERLCRTPAGEGEPLATGPAEAVVLQPEPSAGDGAALAPLIGRAQAGR